MTISLVVLGDGEIRLMFVAVLTNKIGAQVLLFGSNEAWLQIGQKLGTAHSFNSDLAPSSNSSTTNVLAHLPLG